MAKLFQCRWIGLCAVVAGCSLYANASFVNRDFKSAMNTGLLAALGLLGLYIASSFKEDRWAYYYLNFGRFLSIFFLKASILHGGDNWTKTCISTAGLLPWVSYRINWLAFPNERSFSTWPWSKFAYKMLNILRLLVVFLVYQIWKGRHSMTETFFLEKILLSEIWLAFLPFVIRFDGPISLDYSCEVVAIFGAIWSLRDIKWKFV